MKSLLAAVLLSALFSVTIIQAQTSGVPRMIAYAHTTFDGGDYLPTDSGTLLYSWSRGYNTKTASFMFDTNRVYSYQVPYSNYVQRIKEYQLFDSKNDLTLDRTKRISTVDGTWKDSIQYIYTYDTRQNLLTRIKQRHDDVNDAWVNVDMYTYTYDTLNNMTTKLYQLWDITAWQNNYHHDYDYDASNNQIHDLYKVYDTVAMAWVNTWYTLSTYSLANKLIQAQMKRWVKATSSWYDTARYQYIYDGTNTYLLSKLRQVWINPTWDYDTNVVYSYDSNNDMVSELHQYFWGYPTLWMDSALYTYTYDANHNRISSLRQNYIRYPMPSFYQNDKYQTYTYNSFHQMTSLQTTTWNVMGGFWQPVLTDHSNRYYYETTVPTTVSATAKEFGNLSLYPTPANDLLNIDLKWGTEQSAIISIYDMSGKLWNQWQTTTGTTYHNIFPALQMPAGNYIINVKNEAGQLSKIFTIAH